MSEAVKIKDCAAVAVAQSANTLSVLSFVCRHFLSPILGVSMLQNCYLWGHMKALEWSWEMSIEFIILTTTKRILNGQLFSLINKLNTDLIDTLSKSFFSITHFNSGIDHFILLKWGIHFRNWIPNAGITF